MNTILTVQNTSVTLYQLDSKGKVRVWKIEVTDERPFTNAEVAAITMTKGLETGKQTVDSQTITDGKNIGKANETTYFTQALADAQTKVDKKIKEGYVADRNNLKANDELGSGTKAPMLAQKYDPKMKQSGSKDLKKMGIENTQILISRKLDGNRCNIVLKKEDDGTVSATLYSRKGDKTPTNGLEHIIQTLIEKFEKSFDYYFEKYGITEYTLDGELYCKELAFNKLSGLIRKQTKGAQDLIDCKLIKYNLYDVMLPVGYSTRYKVIQNFVSPSTPLVESYEIQATDANIQKYLEQFLSEGEEGAMLRIPHMPYEHKRSWSLVKVKIFEDSEYKIVGITESVRGNMAGNVVLALDSSSNVTFSAGINLSHEECREMWNNQQNYIGKTATIEYFGKNPDTNIPRFPKFKGLRIDL